VTVESEFGEETPDGYGINPHRFEILDADGNMTNASPATSASYSCLADAEELPRETRPGTSSSGAIILDSPVESGFLVFRDRTSGDSYEWEF
jgi:hypothetical protein